jgi:hypothetical protein
MNEIEFIKKLDGASADPPPMDVSDEVLRRIRTGRAAASDPTSLWLPALLSTLAAAAILLLAVQTLSGLNDPFSDLLTPLWTAFQ